MWLFLMAELKEGKTQAEVQALRQSWVAGGDERELLRRCRSAHRYSVVGYSPRQVIWLIDTEDPSVVDLISNHFGEAWNIRTRVVIPQSVGEAVR